MASANADNIITSCQVTSIAAIEFRHEAEKIAEWRKQELTSNLYQPILPEKCNNIDYLKNVFKK